MKAITCFIFILASLLTTSVEAKTIVNTKDEPKSVAAKSAMEREVARHFYYPMSLLKMTGEAEIMLRVLPEGNVEMLMVKTDNLQLREFITKQVAKFHLSKNELHAGEVYRYKLCFKRQA